MKLAPLTEAPLAARTLLRDHRVWPALLLVPVLVACGSSSKPPKTAPPMQTEALTGHPVTVVPPASQKPKTADTEAEADNAKADDAKADEGKDPTVIVLDREKAEKARPRSLAEVAREERERRAREANKPRLVITNKNLSDLATGQVTVIEPKKGGAQDGAKQQDEAGTEVHDEAYWRNRVKDARLRWRRAVDEIQGLEEEVAGLRSRFYAEDDPYVRDSRIKPAWDRALARLEQARQDADRYRKEVQEILEEGRREGALPGWLREGIELEPDVEKAPSKEPDDPMRHRPQEPKVIEPGKGP